MSQEALAAKQHEGIFVGWSNDGTSGQNRVCVHLGILIPCSLSYVSQCMGCSTVDRGGLARLRSARHGRT